jgi:hypothetical protein
MHELMLLENEIRLTVPSEGSSGMLLAAVHDKDVAVSVSNEMLNAIIAIKV